MDAKSQAYDTAE